MLNYFTQRQFLRTVRKIRDVLWSFFYLLRGVSYKKANRNFEETRNSGKHVWDHSFSTYVKFSLKLTILTPWYTHVMCAYQGVRNVSFLDNSAHALNEWSLLFFHLCWFIFLSSFMVFNPFHVNGLFLYPLKIPEKTTSFMMFSDQASKRACKLTKKSNH